jgi:hypothetical protein
MNSQPKSGSNAKDILITHVLIAVIRLLLSVETISFRYHRVVLQQQAISYLVAKTATTAKAAENPTNGTKIHLFILIKESNEYWNILNHLNKSYFIVL